MFGHHHAGHCHWRHRGIGGHRFGRRANPLYYLFAELDTTHGQEKAIMMAFEALREARGAMREELISTRRELAELFDAEALERSALDALLTRQEQHLQKFVQLVRDFIALVHEALEPEQRKKLARLVVDGSFMRGATHDPGWF